MRQCVTSSLSTLPRHNPETEEDFLKMILLLSVLPEGTKDITEDHGIKNLLKKLVSESWFKNIWSQIKNICFFIWGPTDLKGGFLHQWTDRIWYFLTILCINFFFKMATAHVHFLCEISHDPLELLMQQVCREIPLETCAAQLSLLTKFNIWWN